MYSISNFKLLVDKQTEIDTTHQNCDQLIQTTVTPLMDTEVNKLLDAINKKLTEQGFTITVTSTGLIAKYSEAVINVDKHSKDLEECFFINLNNFAEDQVSIVLDISNSMMPKISNNLDGYTEIIEQMTDTLKQARSLEKACTSPKFIYKTQNNTIFNSADEVVNYYFQ
ncbi:hypothetical protein FJQ98_10930 [Lysinibacillus agricola]|uniref:LXG domain-containing protein n=1 Tax=Lysinibacillus agricola TaxID=2590012 RepID=A0ABX7AXE8_9BACI|nr:MULTISPECIES: hypothetical protein [Lysinibacillus]KOS60185.1 hypothetical protein AN161_24070 [Lysinibacillus sp. FJAT-14222]QQP14474.1 hypothetical protein FJQ98_10930 [Lysinibacillus agricola]